MGEPYLGEIKIISWNFAPRGWAFCNGQFLPINQNQALFALLGTYYGGNGQTTFALPNLRGRVPIHQGAGFLLGQAGGQTTHTLTQSEMPAHNHTLRASAANANRSDPANALLAATNNQYAAPGSLTTVHPETLTNVGGTQPHTNMPPYLTLNWCIALQGTFPSQN